MLTLRNVTFMTARPAELAAFWAAALGFTVQRVEDDEVLVADADWSLPRFTFQRVPVAEGRGPRAGAVHVDITADDRAAEVARLVELGAEEVTTHGGGDFRWTVLRDPDGNEFCVTDP